MRIGALEQVADILVEQLQMQSVARVFRRWLLHLSSLVPASQGDWLEFRRNVVHLLPDFHAFFAVTTSSSAPTASVMDDKLVKKLMRTTNERASAFEKTRRKHFFGHNKLQRSGGDPTDTIACTDLSRSCLLLVVAGYLASFNPQETDTNFLSSSGGVRRKKRVKKTGQPSAAAAAQISQFLIGPRIFTLQRLLAIFLNLRAEATADISDQFAPTDAREDIFIHVRTNRHMSYSTRHSKRTHVSSVLVAGFGAAARDARAHAALPAHVAADDARRHQVPLPRGLALRARDGQVPALPARVVPQHGHMTDDASDGRTCVAECTNRRRQLALRPQQLRASS